VRQFFKLLLIVFASLLSYAVVSRLIEETRDFR